MSKEEIIQILQHILDTEANMTEQKRMALQESIAAVKKDQTMEAVQLLLAFLGVVAKLYTHT